MALGEGVIPDGNGSGSTYIDNNTTRNNSTTVDHTSDNTAILAITAATPPPTAANALSPLAQPLAVALDVRGIILRIIVTSG